LLACGLLAVNGDHGTLALTDASAEVLRGERQVMFRRDAPRPVPAAGSGERGGQAGGGDAGTGGKSRRAMPGQITQADLPPSAEPVFERLRAWRAAAAKEQGVPAYVIFHDATLREIAASPPSTLQALATVNGVGETKLARYGQQILDILAERAGSETAGGTQGAAPGA
jgi:ATP-dependent DNA helicase RecQ